MMTVVTKLSGVKIRDLLLKACIFFSFLILFIPILPSSSISDHVSYGVVSNALVIILFRQNILIPSFALPWYLLINLLTFLMRKLKEKSIKTGIKVFSTLCLLSILISVIIADYLASFSYYLIFVVCTILLTFLSIFAAWFDVDTNDFTTSPLNVSKNSKLIVKDVAFDICIGISIFFLFFCLFYGSGDLLFHGILPLSILIGALLCLCILRFKQKDYPVLTRLFLFFAAIISLPIEHIFNADNTTIGFSQLLIIIPVLFFVSYMIFYYLESSDNRQCISNKDNLFLLISTCICFTVLLIPLCPYGADHIHFVGDERLSSSQLGMPILTLFSWESKYYGSCPDAPYLLIVCFVASLFLLLAGRYVNSKWIARIQLGNCVIFPLLTLILISSYGGSTCFGAYIVTIFAIISSSLSFLLSRTFIKKRFYGPLNDGVSLILYILLLIVYISVGVYIAVSMIYAFYIALPVLVGFLLISGVVLASKSVLSPVTNVFIFFIGISVSLSIYHCLNIYANPICIPFDCLFILPFIVLLFVLQLLAPTDNNVEVTG